MSLVLERFRGDGLYLLDEPEAALSPTRQLALLARIHELVRGRSQFVVATHSPLLLAYPEARIFSLESDRIRELAYEDRALRCYAPVPAGPPKHAAAVVR